MNPNPVLNSSCLESSFHYQERILDFLIENYFHCHWSIDLVCSLGNFQFQIVTSHVGGLPVLLVWNNERKAVIRYSTKVLRLTELVFADVRSYEERQMLKEICDFLERN